MYPHRATPLRAALPHLSKAQPFQHSRDGLIYCLLGGLVMYCDQARAVPHSEPFVPAPSKKPRTQTAPFDLLTEARGGKRLMIRVVK